MFAKLLCGGSEGDRGIGDEGDGGVESGGDDGRSEGESNGEGEGDSDSETRANQSVIDNPDLLAEVDRDRL